MMVNREAVNGHESVKQHRTRPVFAANGRKGRKMAEKLEKVLAFIRFFRYNINS